MVMKPQGPSDPQDQPNGRVSDDGDAPDVCRSDLVAQVSNLLPGDVLLFRPSTPDMIQRKISKVTDSPYTHAAIYVGGGYIADSGFPSGVTKRKLTDAMAGSQCVAVLRSQSVFSAERRKKLNEFVAAVIQTSKFYDLVSGVRFEKRSPAYFDNQLAFIRDNYGKVTPRGEFEKQRFICSAFVVACFTVVGIIGETAQAAYQPEHFAPGHLANDATFGWLFGYLVPDGGAISADDPLLNSAMLWADAPEARWW